MVIPTLGKWILEKFGSYKEFAQEIGTNPTLVSRWINGAGIGKDYQERIRSLKYRGPWPAEEAQATPAPAGAAYATPSEVAELRGRIARLEDDVRALLPLALAVKDLDARVQRVERKAGTGE